MKSLSLIKENSKNYDKLRNELIKKAEHKFGKNIFTDFQLPIDFSLNNLDDSIFRNRTTQTLPLPYSNEIFELLKKMPKKAINDVYNFNNKGYNITGVYLIGKYDNKPVLFAFNICRFLAYKDYLNFSIKLDVCVGGKTWLQLLRLDSYGPSHPNYFQNKKVCQKESEVQYVKTPHLHINSQENEILTHNIIDYSPAIELDFNFENFRSDDKTLLKKCFEYFKKYANIEIEINKKIENDYHYDFNNPLYDYSRISQVYSVKEFCK